MRQKGGDKSASHRAVFVDPLAPNGDDGDIYVYIYIYIDR